LNKTNYKSSAIVTGATGFIGYHLVRRLLKEGWEIHVIIRSSSSLSSLKDIRNNIFIHKHNGTTNSMIKIVKDAKPTIVFHLASLFLAKHSSEDIERLVKSNILFGIQLAEAMALDGIKKLVNTGTSWQHFQNDHYNPVCLYAATKQSFEDLVKFYVEAEDLKVITIKLFDTYGPNDIRPKLLSLLWKAVQDKTKLDMSPGNQLIDLVYIDDVIDGYILAAKRLMDNKVSNMEEYFLSSGKPISLKKIVAIYRRIIGQQLLINWGKIPYRKREVIVPWNKGKIIPGWKPKYDLIAGLKKVIGSDLKKNKQSL